KMDALCFVEFNEKITKCFATCIHNKKSETILPLIEKHVLPGTKIYTDEHKSYQKLNSLGFIHGTVCHKYEFVNKETRVNTQAIESFNNYLKYYIKMKKGIEPQRREHFLIEFVLKFNSKENLVSNLFDLIRIK
ncbi:hypothetical protein H312_01154, partial [Anncaliia algerae PRA339]